MSTTTSTLTRIRTVPLTTTAVTLLLILALHAPGVAAFGPTFSGLPGWIAAGGGVLVGLLVALIAARLQWGVLLTAAAALIAYLLFGAPLALPRTAIAGVLPSLDSLQRLALLLFQSWRDLLTVTTPADRFTGPAVVPYLAGLVCALVATTIALRTRRPLFALIPPVVLLVVAIAFGTEIAFRPGWLAAALLAGAVAYAAWTRRAATARDAGMLITSGSGRTPITPILAALVAITLVGGIAAVAGPMLPGGTRHVLRERAEPPLDLHDYASPVTNFRHWKVDRTEDTLFTITGLPEGERLRLATLDTFDGIVFNVERDSAAFVRAGDRIDGADAGRLVALDVSVGEYAGVWLPGVGDWREIEFTGPGASGQADTLYHSHSTSTALTKAGVASGDTFRMTGDLVTSTDRAELKDARTAPDRLPAPSLVPEIVGETAEDLAGDGTTIERLTRMETQLKAGFYSDGRDGKSRAGHTAERISTMLSSPTLIGDDEQYAVTMALMARSLGYPARVVLGFYPEDPAVTSGAWEVRGGDAHVWVEVDFGQHGWVTFDPTPDSDRVPTTEVPRPLPKPDPQVPPPPLPPPHDGEEDPMVNSTDRAIGDRKDLATLFAVLRIIGTVAGIAAAAAAPFLLIAYAKRHRRTRRRRAPRTADSASGSWDELIDTAIDHGNRPPANGTRVEEAKALAAAYPTLPLLDTARRIDDQVYGPLSPPAEAVDQTWQRTADLTAQLKRAHPPLQRFVGFCSLRSFWAGRGVQRSKPELPRPAQTQAAT